MAKSLQTIQNNVPGHGLDSPDGRNQGNRMKAQRHLLLLLLLPSPPTSPFLRSHGSDLVKSVSPLKPSPKRPQNASNPFACIRNTNSQTRQK